MFRKMYQGGSSRKQGPRPAIREQDDEPPRKAQVRPCEWSSEEFMVQAGIKDEFDAYVRNADLEDFMLDKCPQYYTTREKPSNNAGFGPLSSAGTGATNKALQLTYSSSACCPTLLLYMNSCSAL